MGRPRGKEDEVLRADYGRFPFDFNFCFSLEDEKRLLQVGVDMGIGLPTEFEFAQDHFHPLRTAEARSEETPVDGLRMAGRRVGG